MPGTDLLLRLLDILVVAFIFYRLLLLIRGTRAAQMIIGLLAIVLVSIVAEWVRLDTLNWLLASLKTVWIIAFIILFQPELRLALARIGQYGFFRRIVSTESFGVVGHVVAAAEAMSRRRIGGIIVIEQGTGLRNYLETGIRLNSNVTSELLISIFSSQSPLHDGAVIIQGDQVAAARCILPLSQARYPGRPLGTRHRAALGLSDESDSIIIVVSEESGWISIASEGKLTRMKDAAELRSYLSEVLSAGKKKERTGPRLREIFSRSGLPGLSR
jgi:diadenylate cyclase